MSRLKLYVTAALVAGALITASLVGEAQQSGGAFLPTFGYVIGASWTWSTLTPWVVQNGNPATNKYTITFTTPTAARTVTFPNATGTVVLGASAAQGAIRAGQMDVSGANPTSVATGLSTLTACTATMMTSTNPNIKTFNNLSVIFTASAGRLDIFMWTTGSGAASTSLAVPVAYVCVGTV